MGKYPGIHISINAYNETATHVFAVFSIPYITLHGVTIVVMV